MQQRRTVTRLYLLPLDNDLRDVVTANAERRRAGPAQKRQP
ncbi:MAG: hypothetical protein ACK59G_15365 [Cyanobacteriota bacterium]